MIYLGGELIDLIHRDVVRVYPEAYRALKSDDGIPDWNQLPPWSEGNEKIIALYKKIRAKKEGKK